MADKYPKMVVDEVSGIEVPNVLHKAYQDGIEVEKERMLNLVTHCIESTNLRVLIERLIKGYEKESGK